MAGLSQASGVDQPPLLAETIVHNLEQTVAAFPDHEALVVRHQGVRWTYRELWERVDE